MRRCPYCAELIPAASGRCRYCWSKLVPGQASSTSTSRSLGWDAQAQYRPALPAREQPAGESRPGDPRVGRMLVLVGLAVTLFFTLMYDTSAGAPVAAKTPGVIGKIEVHDLGRIQNRRIGIILGLGLLLAGLAVGLPRPEDQAPAAVPELASAPQARSVPAGEIDWRSQADPRYLPED
ncbi:MAG: hypothetical protein HY319_18145 [Armatimonadetes bacterium]|nr:hypothetical protein [Armatimonadota bacterium]